MKDLYVSWDEYNRLIEKLALKVWESGWTFDAILCLARGGLRVGDVMSRLFDKPLGVLFTSSYRENAGTTQSRLLIADHISSAAPMPSGRWLLVDDLVDSGATLVEVIPHLRANRPDVEESAAQCSGERGPQWPNPTITSSICRVIPGFTSRLKNTTT
jgi:hypothetical protein